MLPVLVVEDNPLVAEATGTLLARYGDDVTPVICLDAIQAIRALNGRREAWFRIFVDLDVRASDGPSVVQEVRRHGLAERCCIIGEVDDPEGVEQIKAWNFLGYIDRASPVSMFSAALISVLRGEPSFPASPSPGEGASALLTTRQAELLGLIRNGLSSKEIAARCHLTEGTVNNYVAAILRAVDARSRSHAVARAIELGLLGGSTGTPRPVTRKRSSKT
jgi:DNA-binding NarL/FixJ family response regulator